MGGIGVIFLNFLLRVSCNENSALFEYLTIERRLYHLQDWNITVEENGEVCFDRSVLESLTPEILFFIII